MITLKNFTGRDKIKVTTLINHLNLVNKLFFIISLLEMYKTELTQENNQNQ